VIAVLKTKLMTGSITSIRYKVIDQIHGFDYLLLGLCTFESEVKRQWKGAPFVLPWQSRIWRTNFSAWSRA
jgi:hypothetical protein